MKPLKEAFDSLHLSCEYQNESQLVLIQAFCEKYLSEGVRYEGENASRYQQYWHFANFFLTEFLPNWLSSTDGSKQQAHCVREAARKGYDCFLRSQERLSEKLVNQLDEFGMSALHYAAVAGHPKTVAVLLEKGANPSLLNAQGQFPIHSALWLPALRQPKQIALKIEIVEQLLPLTPDALTRRNNDGDTLFHLLAVGPFEKLTQRLIGAHVDAAMEKNNAGRAPLHTAILNGRLETVRLFMAIPKLAAVKDTHKAIAMHYAARYGQKEMVQLCLQHCPDLDAVDNEGITPLYLAAQTGNLDALDALFSAGADKRIRDAENATILHAAVKGGQISAVEVILDNISKDWMNEEDAHGHTALFYAHGNAVMQALLVKHGAVELGLKR